MTTAELIRIIAVVLFTLGAAICDYRTKKLPNKLTVSCFAAALVYQLATGAFADGWRGAGIGLLTALEGFAVGFGILLVLWLIGGGGAGDVKLMGALGAWFGPTQTLILFFVSTIFVLILSVGVLAWQMINTGAWNVRRRYMSSQNEDDAKRRGLSREAAATQHKLRRRLMPYGVPVALASWMVLAWSLRSHWLGE
ncbi:MAG: A24 family peptidase [Planctomycetia bacterium]|nr:A24 family peptidase [Planctomycetia bacterium]